MSNVKEGKYRHFKGKEYEVLGIAKHSETLEEFVVYKALYGDGQLWIRPLFSFNEMVDQGNKQVPRFEFID